MHLLFGHDKASVAQMVEQLTCNQWVGGSIPFAGSMARNNKLWLSLITREAPRVVERFPSGQREQTVNLPAQPSEVRILPSPPLWCLPHRRA